MPGEAEVRVVDLDFDFVILLVVGLAVSVVVDKEPKTEGLLAAHLQTRETAAAVRVLNGELVRSELGFH